MNASYFVGLDSYEPISKSVDLTATLPPNLPRCRIVGLLSRSDSWLFDSLKVNGEEQLVNDLALAVESIPINYLAPILQRSPKQIYAKGGDTISVRVSLTPGHVAQRCTITVGLSDKV